MDCGAIVDFVSNVASTIVGGVILALLFFSAKEKWFPLPNLTGQWHFQMRTERTEYNSYKGMVLRYVALLWTEGPNVRGTVEKIYEISSTGERPYIGKDRTRGAVSGFVEKRYFSKDLVHLHIVEDGHGRESTHFHDLCVEKGDGMMGRFFAMVADSEGEVLWQRTPF